MRLTAKGTSPPSEGRDGRGSKLREEKMKMLIIILGLRFSNKAVERLFIRLTIWLSGLQATRFIRRMTPMLQTILRWMLGTSQAPPD